MDHKFVFIGGLHRSGTTLLAKVIAQHPDVSGLEDTGVVEDEGQFLQSVYPTDNAYGGPGRFAFDTAAHLTERSTLARQDNFCNLWRAWSPFWNTMKPVLLEKSPPNLIHGRFLQVLFPNAYFIFILRHPAAIAIATRKWTDTGIYPLVHHWVLAHETMKRDVPHLKNVLLISYEEFIKNPKALLERIEDFIGIPSHTYDGNFNNNYNQRYFEQWRRLYYHTADRSRPTPGLRDFQRWKEDSFLYAGGTRRILRRQLHQKLLRTGRQLTLSTHEAQDAVLAFEKSVNEFGYSLVDLTRAPS